MLTYPFLLVGDLMAVNNCGYVCSLPPGPLPRLPGHPDEPFQPLHLHIISCGVSMVLGWAWDAAPLQSLVLTVNVSEDLCVLHRLQAGLPPYSPVFKSWIHCWKYLSVQVSVLGWGLLAAGGCGGGRVDGRHLLGKLQGTKEVLSSPGSPATMWN